MTQSLDNTTYIELLEKLKNEIAQARIRAHLAVNSQLIILYWNIGSLILERQHKEGWGTKVIENISKDLRAEFPEMKGLSSRNLVYMQTFAKAYPDFTFTQEVLAQITWYHNITLLDKVKDYEQRVWYIQKTIENGWSRNVLVLQITTDLYSREGKSISNFKNTFKITYQVQKIWQH